MHLRRKKNNCTYRRFANYSNRICKTRLLVHSINTTQRKSKSRLTYEIGPDLLYNNFLVQFLRILREVIEECHPSASIGTWKEPDKRSEDYDGVFIW